MYEREPHRNSYFTGEELQVKFFEDFCYSIETNGRPVETRTPDLADPIGPLKPTELAMSA